jgi:hypothetical protein
MHTPVDVDRFVTVRGAREHNRKNVDVAIPRNALVVFTGVSGPRKSSLAFGTLYACARHRPQGWREWRLPSLAVSHARASRRGRMGSGIGHVFCRMVVNVTCESINAARDSTP